MSKIRSPGFGDPPPGPFRKSFWRSPLRGPWLTSFLGSALLPLIVICAITGFLSHLAYYPDLGANRVVPAGPIHIYLLPFAWPTSPSWLYALTQGLHVVSGVAAIPILLAKLWSAMPKLFEWPPVRSVAHSLDRLSLALLVGGSLFVFFTGILNIQLFYPWSFSFVPAHYYAAFVFLAALGLHLVTKIPVARRAFREHGVIAPLREDLEHTKPEPPREDSTAPVEPSAPTVSRRGLLATVGAGSVGLAIIAAGQSIGGPLRRLAFLAPRGETAGGPNGFPVNKSAAAVGITAKQTGPGWRLALHGPRSLELSREQLMALDLHTESLQIACVEGWSTTQSWTGVRLRDLAILVGAGNDVEATAESLQEAGAFREATFASSQVADPRSLLALKVNGADLSLDHGFPGTGNRPRGAWSPLHEVGVIHPVRDELMSSFHARYGDRPLHLIAVVIAFSIAGYAFTRIVASPEPLSFVIYFGGAVVAHDLVVFPIYSALHLLAGRAGGAISLSRKTINYVRVPAILSAFAFVVWFPLILSLSTERYVADEGHTPPSYLGRWLGLTAALFLISGIAYALKRRRGQPRGPATGPRRPRSRRSGAEDPPGPGRPRASGPGAR